MKIKIKKIIWLCFAWMLEVGRSGRQTRGWLAPKALNFRGRIQGLAVSAKLWLNWSRLGFT